MVCTIVFVMVSTVMRLRDALCYKELHDRNGRVVTLTIRDARRDLAVLTNTVAS